MHILTSGLLVLGVAQAAVIKKDAPFQNFGQHQKKFNVQLDPRPFYLVDNMDAGPLKDKLQKCSERHFKTSDFVFAHRGASLQFPEHSEEAYRASARMGAGVIECDVTFTKDKKLVCRHAQCDLHTTTDILARPELAAKCTTPFSPYDPVTKTPANAKCCTSDITLAEFKRLCAKMDGFNPNGTTVAEYMDGTANWRTDLYATCAKIMTHDEYIKLVDGLDLKFTPELKTPEVKMPFNGYTQEQFAQDLIDTYKKAKIHPSRVFPQSFLPADVFYWIEKEPAFGKQAVYLDERVDTPAGYANATASLPGLAKRGVRIVAPAFFALTKLDSNKKIIPSEYAIAAKKAGMDIIAWSFERSGPLSEGGDYYYQYVTDAINNDGDMYTVLDVLAKQVGIKAIFTDWASTVTYYANCVGL